MVMQEKTVIDTETVEKDNLVPNLEISAISVRTKTDCGRTKSRVWKVGVSIDDDGKRRGTTTSEEERRVDVCPN